MTHIWVGAPMQPSMAPIGSDDSGNPIMADEDGVQTLAPADHLFGELRLEPWQARFARCNGLPIVTDEPLEEDE